MKSGVKTNNLAFSVDLDILVSHLRVIYRICGLVFKVIVTVNCLARQPLPGNFTIGTLASALTEGRLRLPCSYRSISRKLSATFWTPLG